LTNTERRIRFLEKFALLIERARLEDPPIRFIVWTFYRTPDQQNALYQQGRTTPGKIVTNCDGYTSLSNHQRWLAADILIIKPDGSQDWGPSPAYDRLGEIWRSLGGAWGGDFASLKGDIFHFELGVE